MAQNSRSTGDEAVTIIDEIESTCRSLFSLPNTNRTAQANLLSILDDLDARLGRAVVASKQATEKQNRIDSLVEEIRGWDQNWRADIASAESEKQELAQLIKMAEKRTERSKSGRPTADAILTLARQLARYTAAPPTSQGNVSAYDVDIHATLAKGGILPYPSEEVMRRGLLGQLDRQQGAPAGMEVADGNGDFEQKERQRQQRAAAYAYHQQSQQAQTYQQQTEEAFDLDLNSDSD